MSVSRRIFYNTLAQSFGKIIAIVLGLLTISLLTRYLAEEGFGQYSTVIAYLSLFVVLADLGLYLIVVREISKPEGSSRHPEIIGNALGLRLLASLVVLIAGSLLALLFPYEPIVQAAMFVGIGAFLFVSLNQVLIGIFQKHLVQHLVVFSETIGRAVNLVLVYLFIRQSLAMPFFVLALLASNGTIFFFTLLFARRLEKFRIEFKLKVWRRLLAASWPLVFAIVLNLLYFKTDTVILSVFQSPEAVGVYSLPYKILEGLLAFPAMFVGLIMPLLSASAFADWEKFQRILQRAFDAVLLMAIPVVLVTQFFAEKIVDLVKGGREYLDSPALLKILILATGIIFLGTLFGYAVVAAGKQKPMIKGYLLGAVSGLVLYFSLIPTYSYWGAAWGTVATEAIVAVYAYLLVYRACGRHLSVKIMAQALPAALIMALSFSLISVFWLLEIALGLALYGLFLFLFKAVPVNFVKEILFLKR